LTKDRDRKIDLLNTRQNVRYEIAFFKCACVSAVRRLIVGGSVNVVENRGRKPPPGQLTEVIEIDAVLQAHVRAAPRRAVAAIATATGDARRLSYWCTVILHLGIGFRTYV
jgi:hypothetical protein